MEPDSENPFHTWLMKRNFDPAQLELGAPAVYSRWQALFDQLHPDSFWNQIRFELNTVRREIQRTQPPLAE
jgi:hypothetical protein